MTCVWGQRGLFVLKFRPSWDPEIDGGPVPKGTWIGTSLVTVVGPKEVPREEGYRSVDGRVWVIKLRRSGLLTP